MVGVQRGATRSLGDLDTAQACHLVEEPERPAPYLDDQQRLRSPVGEVVDVMGTDWHDKPWYAEAAQLLRDAGYEHAGEDVT